MSIIDLTTHTKISAVSPRAVIVLGFFDGVHIGHVSLFDEAKRLADLIKDMHGHVNLIPVNPIKERDYKQSNREATEQFKGYLEKKGINVTVRREMGRDIGGACGQLRKSYLKKEGVSES